jgi:hypothetical protein
MKFIFPQHRQILPEASYFSRRPKDFQNGTISTDCPRYWSFDSSGDELLDLADAVNLGFPSLTFSMGIRGESSGEPTVYAGLRKFHQAKGFDPDSQDVARHLVYSLYHINGEINIPFAHSELSFCKFVNTHQ